MYQFAPILAVLAGVAAFAITMDDWLRLALECILGVFAIVWIASQPSHNG